MKSHPSAPVAFASLDAMRLERITIRDYDALESIEVLMKLMWRDEGTIKAEKEK